MDETETILRERGDLEQGGTEEKPTFTAPLADLESLEILWKMFSSPQIPIHINTEINTEKYHVGAPDWHPLKIGDKVRTNKKHNTILETQESIEDGIIVHMTTNETETNTIAVVRIGDAVREISTYWLEKIT